MNTEKLLFAFFLSLILLFNSNTCTTTANQTLNQNCSPSSCGNISNISYPFRLKSDPEGCGVDVYELSCEDNTTVLYLNGGKFNVKAINYNNYTIRVVDPGVDNDDCSSLPRFPLLSRHNFSDYGSMYSIPYKIWTMTTNLVEPVEVIKCVEPVNSTTYLDASSCFQQLNAHSSFVYRYAYVGGVSGFDLRKGCSIEAMTLIKSSDTSVSSYIEFNRRIVFGFELVFIECSYYCGFRYCSLVSTGIVNCDNIHNNIGTFKRATKRLKNYAEAFGYGLQDLCRYISILFGSHFSIKRVFQEIEDDKGYYSALPYWPNHVAGLLDSRMCEKILAQYCDLLDDEDGDDAVSIGNLA